MNNENTNHSGIWEMLWSNNCENIKSGDDAFLPIFVVRLKTTGREYGIFRPLCNIEGVEPDEALVYLIEGDELYRITYAEIIKEIFDYYYQAIREENPDVERYCLKLKDEIYKPYSLDSFDDIIENTRLIRRYNRMMEVFYKMRCGVKGQLAAIMCLLRMIFGMGDVPIFRDHGPAGIVTFLGAPGIGKTTLLTMLQRILGGKIIYLNCSTMTDRESSVFQITGIGKEFKGGGHGGILTMAVWQAPFGITVCLVDEPDKGHSNVRMLFYQALDNGQLYDNFKRIDVDLSNVIFVFATNVGERIYKNRFGEPKVYNMADVPKEVIIEAMKEARDNEGNIIFTDALLSRLSQGEMKVLNNLAPIHVKEILVDEINMRIEEFRHHEKVNFKIDAEGLAELLIYKNSNDLDIRKMKKEVVDFFANQVLYSTTLIGDKNPDSCIKEIRCDFNICGKDCGVDYLLGREKKPKLLLFGKLSDIPELSKLDEVEIIEGNADSIDDYTTSNSEVDLVLFDATSSIAKTRKIFDAIKERSNAQMFVFSRNDISFGDLYYFVDNGIDDYHMPNLEISFDDWLAKLRGGAILASVCNKLSDKLKSIFFYENYLYDKKTGILHITVDPFVKDVYARAINGKIKTWPLRVREQLAIHEACHAIVGHFLDRSINLITIESRGNTGGYVMTDESDAFAYNESQLRNIICQLLAGRVGEELVYSRDGITTGAADDLKKATKLATDIICKYGMVGSLMVNEDTKSMAPEIEKILQAEYDRARTILSERMNVVYKLSDKLIAERSLNKEEIERIINDEND